MKKTFLKSVVAAVVVTTAVALSSVAAFAATTMWVPNDDGADTAPASLGMVYDSSSTLTMSSSRTGYFKDAIFADGTGKFASKSGINIQSGVSGLPDTKSIAITPDENGTVSLYIARQSSDSGAAISLFNATVDGTTYTKGEQIGSTITSGGRSTADIEAITFDVVGGNSYLIYSNNSGAALFGIKLEGTGSEVLYWPTAESPTDASSSWIGGAPTTYFDKDTALNGATLVGGKVSSGKKVRFGKDALATGAEVTIENMGYITFPGLDGDFNVVVNAASSGSAARPVALGTFDGTEFTKIADFETVASATPDDVTISVAGGSSATTYAIYLEPKADGTVADNTDIYAVSVISPSAVYVTTPEVTLSSATVEGDVLTITGTFNDFSGTYYEVDKITLNAATGKTTQDDAVWTANDITNLKDNGDGTVSFIAKATAPTTSAKFQAIAHYTGIDENTADVDTNAVSNLVTYAVSVAE